MSDDPIAVSHSEHIQPIIEQSIDPMQLDPIPSDLPEDTKYLGDRLDNILTALRDIAAADIRNETPSPGMYFLQATHNDFPQTVRTRIVSLVLGSSAAGNIAVVVGTATLLTVNFGAADTKVIPLPITIDAGKDVTLVAGGGAAITAAFVTGYPESDKLP